MKKISNFRFNSIAFGSILLITAFNASQLASLGQPMPREDPGKPSTQSGGPRFVPPAEDIDIRQRNLPPRGVRGGGCAIDVNDPTPINITPLAPPNNFARTVSDYPTFLFYLPQTKATLAEFTLLDPSKKEIYKQTLAISNLSGTIEVRIPANKNVPPLEAGKSYRWSFTVICDSQDRSADLLEMGTVRRVELSADIRSQLEKADPRQKSFIYAENGIWQDAISTLAEARRAKPDDPTLKADWESLLDSVQLGKIAKEPIVQIEVSQPQP
jgi:hypothetical protein